MIFLIFVLKTLIVGRCYTHLAEYQQSMFLTKNKNIAQTCSLDDLMLFCDVYCICH